MAIINGKPSLFLPVPAPAPAPDFPDYSIYHAAAVRLATSMANDPNPASEAEREAAEAEWLADETAQAELFAWHESVNAANRAAEEANREAYEADQERRAAEWEAEQLGEAYAEELNADPFRFTG